MLLCGKNGQLAEVSHNLVTLLRVFEEAEDFGAGGFGVGGVEHGGRLLLGDGEAVPQEAPVFFGFAQVGLVGDGLGVDGVDEGEDELGIGN